jgi:trans-2,3-dihydro-3-hydroxyanthranilate isomerase
MQAIAREMNLSETVFVDRPEQGGHAKLRIFTPRSEVDFAGHPVLGTAFVLGGALQAEAVRLEIASGTVEVQLERDGARIVFGWMQQPIPSIQPFAETAELLGALGVEQPALPVELYDNGMRHVMVKLGSPRAVAELTPNFPRIARLALDCTSVFAGENAQYRTRVFAPAQGIDEDPATGSAVGPLALHLLRHGELEPGQTLQVKQGAEVARPSTLYARIVGSQLAPLVGGAAVIVGRGELRI